VAVKYAVWSRNPDVQQDSVYATPYLEKELLVRFNPDLINPAFVDNPDLTFDRLGNLIPASVISAMNQQVGSGIDFATVMVEKVHKRMTRADSISTSHLFDIWASCVRCGTTCVAMDSLGSGRACREIHAAPDRKGRTSQQMAQSKSFAADTKPLICCQITRCEARHRKQRSQDCWH